MNYLAIDTSDKHFTAIFCKDGKITKYFDADCGVKHSIDIMPVIERFASELDFELSGVDFFACVVGAGSFTGIRIGVATIKALCFAYNKPCLSITSFDTLAYNDIGGKILAVIDAKHDCFYACGYDGEKVVFEPSFISKEKLIELSNDFTLFVSDNAWDIDWLKVKKVSVVQGLINGIENKLNDISSDIQSLVPLYVRKSQAEENR